MCSPQDVNICTLPRQVMEFIFGRGALRDSDRDFRGEDVKIDWWRQSKTKSIGSLGSMCTWHVLYSMIWTGWSLKRPMAMLGESINPIVSEGFKFLRGPTVYCIFWALCHVKSSVTPYRSGSVPLSSEAICDQVSRSSPGISSCHNLRLWSEEICLQKDGPQRFQSPKHTTSNKTTSKNNRWSWVFRFPGVVLEFCISCHMPHSSMKLSKITRSSLHKLIDSHRFTIVPRKKYQP